MPNEPGRERHMSYKCEHCGSWFSHQLTYHDWQDEYWCSDCLDNEAEAAYDRHQESLMENGPGPSLGEQQAAARKFK